MVLSEVLDAYRVLFKRTFGRETSLKDDEIKEILRRPSVESVLCRMLAKEASLLPQAWSSID